MFRHCNEEIFSQEGTSQGDPLSMLMYAIGVLPLIRPLNSNTWIQSWYADDSSCIGKLENVKKWLEKLLIEGPKWGYYPEPEKSVLVIKENYNGDFSMFNELNIKVVHSQKFLGSIIGSNESKVSFIERKINCWIEDIKKLSIAAKKPQAAYATFTNTLQFKWIFVQRVVDCSDEKKLKR